jgi:hypothetical protein
MPNAEELNLKLLERALDQHESARTAFYRDVKVVAVALIIFQCFVFFRFTALSDDLLVLQPQWDQAVADQNALKHVHGALTAFKTALDSGSSEMARSVRNVPQDIRNELGKLDDELRTIREGRAAPRSMLQQNIAQQSMPLDQPFSGQFEGFLTENDADVLRRAKPDDPAYNQIVIRLVEAQIIQPIYARLNQETETKLTKPLNDALTDLRKQEAAFTRLRATGAEIDRWLANAATVVNATETLTFAPPNATLWWTSASTKAVVADAAQLNVAKITDEATAKLRGHDQELQALAHKLESTTAELQLRGTAIQTQLDQLTTNLSEIETYIESYARPLAWIALEPKELVIFFPVVFATLVAVFAFRYLKLQRHSAALARSYRELGVTSTILALSFPELSSHAAVKPAASRSLPSSQRLLAWSWIIPAGLAALSFFWVLRSQSLSGEAPRILYLSSAVVLVVTGIFLLRSQRTSSHSIAPAPLP